MDTDAINRMVAEKIFGWTWSRDHATPCWRVSPEDPYFREYDLSRHVPEFATSIADAWPVVEKMRERGGNLFCLTLMCPESDGQRWLCVAHDASSGSAPTAPLAICLAALKAVGCEVPA